jgi:hypothetical protein
MELMQLLMTFHEFVKWSEYIAMELMQLLMTFHV